MRVQTLSVITVACIFFATVFYCIYKFYDVRHDFYQLERKNLDNAITIRLLREDIKEKNKLIKELNKGLKKQCNIDTTF